jgi:hypothetical protein
MRGSRKEQKRAEKRIEAVATEGYRAMVVYMEVYQPPVLISVVRPDAAYYLCPLGKNYVSQTTQNLCVD